MGMVKVGEAQWKSIKRSLLIAQLNRRWILIFVGAILPILESVLCNLYTSSTGQSATALGWSLIAIGLFHTVLFGLVLFGENENSSDFVTKSAELESQLKDTTDELVRRSIAYRSFRAAFAKLNNEVCRIQNEWCQNGFAKELEPIIALINNDAKTTLGVKHDVYTLEVFCDQGMVEACRDAGDRARMRVEQLELLYFASTRVPQTKISVLGRRAPAAIARHQDTPMTKTLAQAPEAYLENGQPRDDVYFQQFAAVPIKFVCSDESQGVLVLTSMQNEPFASDVLDSLEFIAAIVTQFISEYNACIQDSRQT